LDSPVYETGPNFLHVVLFASLALGVMLILAYVILVGVGDLLLPSAHSAVQPAARFALFFLGILVP